MKTSLRQGLPQGAFISCFLFIVLINDVLADVKSTPGIEALLYVNDLILWASSDKLCPAKSRTMGKKKKKNKMIVSTEKTVSKPICVE